MRVSPRRKKDSTCVSFRLVGLFLLFLLGAIQYFSFYDHETTILNVAIATTPSPNSYTRGETPKEALGAPNLETIEEKIPAASIPDTQEDDRHQLQRPNPLQCSYLDTLPPVPSRNVTNKCVPGNFFQQTVHASGDVVSQEIASFGCWERNIVSSIVQHFDKPAPFPKTFVDVGGNIGAFTTTLAQMGHEVVTIEPFRLNVPLILETLCRANPGGLDKVSLFKVALSDTSPGQKMCLWSTNSEMNNGNARMVPYFEGTQNFGQDIAKTCMEIIYSYTLDELLGLNPGDSSAAEPLLKHRPWGMKMDIEGYETKALRGASQLLSRQFAPCRIWFEYQSEVTVESGASANEIFETLFQKAGYTELYVAANGNAWEAVDLHAPNFRNGDYMAVHGDPECPSSSEAEDVGNPPKQEVPVESILGTPEDDQHNRPKPLQCSDLDTLPTVPSRNVTNRCVNSPSQWFPQSVHQQGDVVSQEIANTGCWERNIVSSIVQHFEEPAPFPKTFVDVGGNIGAFTTTLAQMGHEVITVEPFRLNVPLILETLCRANPGGLDKVSLFKVALSDVSPGQKMCLWSTNSEKNNGNARMVPYFEGTQNFGQDKKKTCMEIIYSYTLDELLGLIPWISAEPLLKHRPWGMKMDIEGYETKALRGASHLLSPQFAPCRIWFEYQREVTVESGAGANEIFETLFQKAGYTELYVAANGNAWEAVDLHAPNFRNGDYMAVRGDLECQSSLGDIGAVAGMTAETQQNPFF